MIPFFRGFVKNGREDRIREKKVSGWVLSLSLFFFISFFLAPALVSPGTIVDLEGRANAIDFASEEGRYGYGNIGKANDSMFLWTDLNVYSGFIYAFGDLNCHNKAERSWEVNGNQMPVCTRDLGIFLGVAIGGAIFRGRGYNRWTVKDTVISIFNEKFLDKIYAKGWRNILFFGCALLAILPLGIDGFTQLLTSYESNNPLRIATGIPFGAGLGILIAGMYSARPNLFGSVSDVKLPAGIRFELLKQEE